MLKLLPLLTSQKKKKSSLVIDTLSGQVVGKNEAVFYLYFDFPAQDEQTPTNMLGGLLKQIVAHLAKVPEGVAKAFRQSRENPSGGGLRLPDILILLQKVLNSFDQVFICTDALDECLTKHRPEFLRSLRCLIQGLPGTRLFFTGRPQIQAEIIKCTSENAATVPIVTSTEDIDPRNCALLFWNSLSGPNARHGEYQNISVISSIDIGLVPYLLPVLKALSWVLIVDT